jgi:hypothetical protein
LLTGTDSPNVVTIAAEAAEAPIASMDPTAATTLNRAALLMTLHPFDEFPGRMLFCLPCLSGRIRGQVR